MLTLDMLFAVLQGLPADHLKHLHRPWYLLAWRIERGLKEGLDPVSALHAALSNSHKWEREHYLRAFEHEEPVLALPDLTQRQKEALVALRYAGASSLTQLTRVLAQDRSNTRRRLDFLVEKGYAFKYFANEGACYMAITAPIPDGTRSEAIEMMQAFKQALLASQESPSQESSPAKLVPSEPRSGIACPERMRREGSEIINSSPPSNSSGRSPGLRGPTTTTSTTRPTSNTGTTRESNNTGATGTTNLPRPP